MMQLKEYLFYYKLNKQEFADKAGVHRLTIDNICHARIKTIKIDTYEKICKASDGKVKIEDLIEEIKGIDPCYRFNDNEKAKAN
jgi:DNA-binding Xre family transcriptional regulator